MASHPPSGGKARSAVSDPARSGRPSSRRHGPGRWLRPGLLPGTDSAGYSPSIGVEFDRERAAAAGLRLTPVGASAACARSEALPFPSSAFDLILSHEVLEHVVDDRTRFARSCGCSRRAAGWSCSFPTGDTPSKRTASTGAASTVSETYLGQLPALGLRDRLAPHVRAYAAS